MKQILFLFLFILIATFNPISAQHVKIKLNFPSGIDVNAPDHSPYRNAIWIGPEWKWDNNHYIYIPGNWVRATRKHQHWKSGFWKRKRCGFIWISGHW